MNQFKTSSSPSSRGTNLGSTDLLAMANNVSQHRSLRLVAEVLAAADPEEWNEGNVLMGNHNATPRSGARSRSRKSKIDHLISILDEIESIVDVNDFNSSCFSSSS